VVLPREVDAAREFLKRTLEIWRNKAAVCPDTGPVPDTWWSVCYTAGGLAYLTKWGTLRHTANVAFASTAYAAIVDAGAGSKADARVLRCWARSQLQYAAGKNPAKQSYIVGYAPDGLVAADRPHHRSSSCDPDWEKPCTFDQLNVAAPNPSVLKGALVGGPDNLDTFNNTRSNYISNEVSLDYQSGKGWRWQYLTMGYVCVRGD
jgi:hypothetical protein